MMKNIFLNFMNSRPHGADIETLNVFYKQVAPMGLILKY